MARQAAPNAPLLLVGLLLVTLVMMGAGVWLVADSCSRRTELPEPTWTDEDTRTVSIVNGTDRLLTDVRVTLAAEEYGAGDLKPGEQHVRILDAPIPGSFLLTITGRYEDRLEFTRSANFTNHPAGPLGVTIGTGDVLHFR